LDTQLFDYCLIERSEVRAFYNSFIREITEQPTSYQEIATISFRAFLLLFVRELHEGRFSHALHGQGGMHQALHSHSNPVELALRHIDYHLNQNLTTQSVADSAYMSRSNFIRCFHQETGQTFNLYLTTRLLEEGPDLLPNFISHISGVFRFVFVASRRQTA
jgi:YesN/AraC family two-component response regulator